MKAKSPERNGELGTDWAITGKKSGCNRLVEKPKTEPVGYSVFVFSPVFISSLQPIVLENSIYQLYLKILFYY